MAKKKVVEPQISLSDIVAAGVNGLLVTPEVYKPLLAAGLVEVNLESGAGLNGAMPTRATEAGIASMNHAIEEVPAVVQNVLIQQANAFEIEDDIPLPTGSGRGRAKGEMYPFDKLLPGQSFFVPNSEDKPNVAKSLASTVSGATARYAIVDPSGATKVNRNGEFVPATIATRKFIVRPFVKDGVEGARVYRTA